MQRPELKNGEVYVGAIISADGRLNHHVILLSDEFVGSWNDAMHWAESLEGGLPTRVESALLFATLRHKIEEEWHWTNEQNKRDSDYAWLQSFDEGDQGSTLKSCGYRARAIRRVSI